MSVGLYEMPITFEYREVVISNQLPNLDIRFDYLSGVFRTHGRVLLGFNAGLNSPQQRRLLKSLLINLSE